jgi:predicted ATP-dependent endonuclease of OLD family
MKINRLEVTNFRGIGEFKKELKNPLTDKPLDIVVFAGPNGSGKTSLLESIVITLTNPRTKEDKTFKRNNGRDGQDPSVTIELMDGADYHRISYQSTTDGNDRLIRNSLQDKYEYFSSWREPLLKGALYVTLGRKGKRPQDVEVNRLWNLKQFLINAYVSDKLSQEMSLSPNSYEESISRIEQALGSFFPGSDIDIRIQQVGASIEDGFDVFLKYPNTNHHYVALDDLSSGEIELFSFLSSILRKELANGILIIDEPELHLHVSWHRVFLSALRELLPDTQIICATHSLEIIESVKSYELFLLGEDDDYRSGVGSYE